MIFSLTVHLLRIQSISAVLFGIGGLVIAILNAHQIFFVPQITAAMYQLGQIFGVLVLSRWMGIYGLAWGVVIGSAFLPTFTALLVREEKKAAWRLASSLINLVTLFLTVAVLLASIFAPQIVHYFLAPGLSRDPAIFAVTVNLLRIQSISAVLFGVGGLVIAILNAHQIFFVPQITAAMYQIGQIFGRT